MGGYARSDVSLCPGQDGELKRQLVRAALAAIDAIRQVDPGARMVFPEPLIHNVPPRWRPWITAPAAAQRASQFEAWDMIAGRAAPGAGRRRAITWISSGVNFYAANQWEVPGGRKLHWDAGSDDPRWMPLHKLLAEVHERYQRPMLIAETSHYGIGRAPWLHEIARGMPAGARATASPLHGVCLYPILDRFDWEDCTHWHNSGLWDMTRNGTGNYRRALNGAYAQALCAMRKLFFPDRFTALCCELRHSGRQAASIGARSRPL